MTTFLLDLDNTLLTNDMQSFLPPYIALLSTRLQPYAGGRNVGKALIASVQAVVANADSTTTNMDRFLADFSARLSCPAEIIRAAMTRFFAEDYPQLQHFTAPRPDAPRVVRRLLDAGHQVVIATNPLFPAVAIQQRLAWAGIADFPYARVTTMENSCFAKPDPRYYREILDAIDEIPQNAWMVGDDPQNDIVPAASLGIKTWWLTDGESSPGAPFHCRGSLSDFLDWIE